MERKHCTAVVLAAGKGTRMGTEVAKQYLHIDGRPVVYYALKAFEDSPWIDDVILMTGEGQQAYCQKEIVERYGIRKVKAICAGGRERYESVYKALQLLREKPETRNEEGYVFIHDGARPFVSQDMIERAYHAVEEWQACVIGMPVKDTIKITDENGVIVQSPDRRLVWQAQTPQVFFVPLILEAFDRLMEHVPQGITDDAMVLETQTGRQVRMVEGSYENIKITTPEDLLLAESILRGRKVSAPT